MAGHICPQCQRPLVEKTNRSSGVVFLACSEWPECDFTTPLPPDLIMRKLGAEFLPGFE